MGRLLCRLYVRDCLVCFASCLSDWSDARLLMGGSEGEFLWRPMLSAHLWRLRSFLPFAMSIGTFVWAGRTAAAAAARHATNLLPAAIHRNNRKNKGIADKLKLSVFPKKGAVARSFLASCNSLFLLSTRDHIMKESLTNPSSFCPEQILSFVGLYLSDALRN